MEPRDVRAAGAVVTRKGGEVLLVHRPKYDDWSFPKGKLDRGEHTVVAAVREVAEETGLDVRLGPALSPQRYRMSNGRWKTVDYWTARVAGSDDVSRYRPNDEIDAVEWVDWEDAHAAAHLPLRPRDPGRGAAAAAAYPGTGRCCATPRRAPATGGGRTTGGARSSALGETQSQRLVPLLAAFDVTAAHTSSSTRCVQTVMPYADVTGWPVKLHDELSEEGATLEGVVDLVDGFLDGDLDAGSAVLCTHRPVLPTVLDALQVPDVELEPGSMLVVHHRKGRVVATQHVAP